MNIMMPVKQKAAHSTATTSATGLPTPTPRKPMPMASSTATTAREATKQASPLPARMSARDSGVLRRRRKVPYMRSYTSEMAKPAQQPMSAHRTAAGNETSKPERGRVPSRTTGRR